MPADAQNIEKQTPQFLFPSSVNQLNVLNFFQVEEIVVRREIVLPVIILEDFVFTFSVMEPLLACVFWGHKETRHYTS